MEGYVNGELGYWLKSMTCIAIGSLKKSQKVRVVGGFEVRNFDNANEMDGNSLVDAAPAMEEVEAMAKNTRCRLMLMAAD